MTKQAGKNLHIILCVLLAASTFFSATAQSILADDTVSWPSDISAESQSAVLMNYETGTVLYEQNPDDELYPASITKILTALIAIENSDLSEIVTFSEASIYNTEGSSIARDVGEEMTMEQCLYGMMLESANECAYAIAEHVGGTLENFVDMMNEKAAELGCTHTHFNNPNGLPDEEHYTSAMDMALIAKAAYANETFRIVCGTEYYEIPATNKHEDITYLRNHHNMLYPYSSYLYDGCVGGKTGYTTEANSTLVTFAQRNDMTLICVVMNANAPQHYLDTINLFDWGFANFTMWNVADNETSYTTPLESFYESDSLLFDSRNSLITLDETAQIILPAGADFSQVQSALVYDEDNVPSLEYTYDSKNVGYASFTMTDISDITFALPSDIANTSVKGSNDADEPLEIPLVKVFMWAGIAVVVVIIIILLVFFQKNYYIIRHKIETRRGRDSFNAYSKREERRRRREHKREMKRRSKW